MSNIILTFTSITIQTLMTLYLIIVFSQIFEKKKHTKTKIIATAIIILTACIITNIVPMPITLLKPIISSLFTFISLYFILKCSLAKSILVIIFTIVLSCMTELLAVIIVSSLFNYDANNLDANFKILFAVILVQMIILFIIIKTFSLIVSKLKNINEIIENANSNQLLNLILICVICILPKIAMRIFYRYEYSTSFLLISVIETIVMVALTFIFFKRTLERDKAQSDLFISETHNKTMIGMVDGVKTLKHDYNNIMQALSGYVATKQYDKLEEHINKVLQECNVVNNFSTITPELFNEPAIYGIMGAKYFLAADKDIKVDLDITCDFTKISFPMPELSRILGIILDNAMEATEKSNNKYIRFEARYDSRKNADVLKIVNTYDTSINIDLEKIYEKGVSSKKVKSGIGLWEVKKLIKKNKNSQIYPTIENNKFVQNIVIERISDVTQNEQSQENKSKQNKKDKSKTVMLIPIKNKKYVSSA